MIFCVRDLSRELARAGVPRRLRRRIEAEFTDHLACDPQAELGRAADVARSFADQLGTSRVRRAAFAAFAALAIAGSLFAVAFVSAGWAGPNGSRVYMSSAAAGYAGTVLVLFVPQLALVAGSLAALRAFRRRHDTVIPRREATVIGRRTTVALASGLASMGGLLLLGLEFNGRLAGWWTSLTLAAAAAGTCAIAIALPAFVFAARLRPLARGSAGDLFDDLDGVVPARLQGRPWALACFVAGAVGLAVALSGALQADGIDGALRGLAEALACLIGFALLGRYLGLRGQVPGRRSPIQ